MPNWPQPMLRPVDSAATSARVSAGYPPSSTAGQFLVIAIGAMAHAFTKYLQEIMPGYFSLEPPASARFLKLIKAG